MIYSLRQNFMITALIFATTAPALFAENKAADLKIEDSSTELPELQTPANPSDIPSEIKLVKDSNELTISKNQFLENEQLLTDLFNELEDSEELRNLPPETPENFKHLIILKEIYKFAHKQNPTRIKLLTATVLGSLAYLNYRFTKARYATAGILGSAVLADFLTTRYSYRKN